ncbi:MAG: PBECR4 domain-containing protein [Lachnospiraceae bacterium]|nr:PBECR4 domain-containing protein [Lachnospiraceae bacterium]
MKQFTKEQALSIVINCAHKYRENLSGCKLLFLLSDKHMKVTALEVSFEERHFLHLTGLKVNHNISASRFFDHCIDGTLSPNDFTFSEDGTTMLKLEVLMQIMEKDLSANMVADYNGINPRLYTEKLAGNVKACIGFVWSGNIGYVPNTLLNLDIRKTSEAQRRIIVTYRKKRNDSAYSEMVYYAKKVDWAKIKYPDEYAYLPKPKQDKNIAGGMDT